MLNPITLYEEMGHKAGKAEATKNIQAMRFYARWIKQALSLEASEDRLTIKMTYDSARMAALTSGEQ